MQKTNFMTMMTVLAFTWSVSVAYAGFQPGESDGCNGVPDLLIGADNDNENNPVIQPIAPPPNQSLNNADVLDGRDGCDVLIGLQGNDVLRGGGGSDILIGGTEQGDPDGFGNRDVIFGDGGNDVNIWAPGDGSDAFIGGAGNRDAMVFGVIDRDANNIPTLSPDDGGFIHTGVPTTDVSGSPGFCTVERVNDPELGYEFLVRFFVRRTGALAVTIRLAEVEQVFCTSEAGGQITYADLTAYSPAFAVISSDDVQRLNPLVAKIIR